MMSFAKLSDVCRGDPCGSPPCQLPQIEVKTTSGDHKGRPYKHRSNLKVFLFKLLTLFSLFFLSSSSFAAESATQSLENTLAHIQTMQANFSQTIRVGDQINQQLFGIFKLKRPGKFFWQTVKPIHQDIISNGKKIWIYDKDLEQIMVKPLEQNVGATPALLLNGKAGSIAKNYRVTLKNNINNKSMKNNANTKPEKTYILIPKEKTLYNDIKITFQGNTLVHMSFEDSLGQVTDFSFTQVKINGPISDSAFLFVPPKQVDVVYG